MKELFERFLALLVALPFVGTIFSIVYFAEKHRSQLLAKGQVVILDCGQQFGCPQEYWLMTTTGAVYAIVILCVLVVACFVLSKCFSDFKLKAWLLIVGFGWLATTSGFIADFCVHKDDYICLSQIGIAQKYGRFEWQAKNTEIRKIKREGKAFIVYLKSRKVVRITDARISRLYDREILCKQLITLSENI